MANNKKIILISYLPITSRQPTMWIAVVRRLVVVTKHGNEDRK